ncbi:acetyl-coenzyme A transporter 1-domain-containing protein [Zopfochytrium polystomum]|nr:acetyl-coenzyme A transporter 1-domain-containing protein [Zopfochytrium polystomum]
MARSRNRSSAGSSNGRNGGGGSTDSASSSRSGGSRSVKIDAGVALPAHDAHHAHREDRSAAAPLLGGGDDGADRASSNAPLAADHASTLLTKDLGNFSLLVVLYLLQGIPLGLTFGSVPYLLKAKATFSDLALFSLSSYPYSLKLLWSPIVDTLYLPSVGRRKSWIVPIQLITGIFLIVLGSSTQSILASDPLPVSFLALSFTALVLLCATQDIAVDGWALTLLAEENKAYASTAQTVGLNTGYFLSFTVFLALNSEEFCTKYLGASGTLLELGGYMQFWGAMFLLCNVWLVLFQREKNDAPETSDVSEVYKQIIQVCSMPHMRKFIFLLFVCKIGFAANEAVTALKLLDKGFQKEDLALAVLIDFPLQIAFGYYVAGWSRGSKPLRPWLFSNYVRLFFAFFSVVIVANAPSGRVTTEYFVFVLVCSVLSSCASTVSFVGMGAYFTKISDPAIGGTYMTLLNTLSNLGGTWPRYFVLQAVEYFTASKCTSKSAASLAPEVLDKLSSIRCNTEHSKLECAAIEGGTCEVVTDGYYSVSIACATAGLLVLVAVVRPLVRKLEAMPDEAWRLPGSGDRPLLKHDSAEVEEWEMKGRDASRPKAE